MKKMLLMAAALVLAASCAKEVRTAEAECKVEGNEEEIVFQAGGLGVDVQTRTAVVTKDNLESLSIVATTGGGAGTFFWSVVAQKEEDKFVTGKYWPANNPSYHFYASNHEIVMEGGEPKMTVDRSLDVVAGQLMSPTFRGTNEIPLSHILCRIGEITIESSKGYTLSNVNIKLRTAYTGGKYNLYSEEWEDYTTVSDLPLQLGSNDEMLVAHKDQSITVQYTMTKGDYTHTFTSTSGLKLEAGKVCTVKLTATGDPAIPIKFDVSLADWGSMESPVSLK